MAGMAGNANENDVENDKKALSFGSAEGCVYICFVLTYQAPRLLTNGENGLV